MVNKLKLVEFENYNYSVSKYLFNHLNEMLKEKNINVCVPGGKTPLPIFKMMFNEVKFINKLSLFITDERNCHNYHSDNNFFNLSKTLPINNNITLEPIFTASKEIDDAVLSYSELINKLPKKNKKPYFDLMILGMGEDGHIASLFPDTEAINEKKKYVVKNYVPKLKNYRVTITYPLINNSEKIMLLIKGSNKKKLLFNYNSSHPISKILETREDLEILCSK